MTIADEAQPKKARRRRATFPKRLELRVTDAQLALALSAREAAEERTGRKVTLSEVHRSALTDGCRSLISGPAPSTEVSIQALAVLDGVAEEMRLVRGDLRRIGHNANQLAVRAHHTGVVGDVKDLLRQLVILDRRLVLIARKAAHAASGAVR
ncbi:hypothetical protein GCM10009672_18230 [Nesterenkonia lutea]